MSQDFPVTVTEKALAHLAKIIAKDARQGVFLRVGVKGGGCSGFEYVMKLDEKRLPIDTEKTFGDVTIVCDSKSAKFLEGAELDYTGNLVGGGFKFENPNVKSSCGCGESVQF